MRKLLLGVLAVIVIAAAAALVAPSFIDWNAYRSEIAAEVRKATGRELRIEGSIDVALLPTPKLSLTDTRLSNLEGAADPDMLRLSALDLRIALWPLLSGEVVVESVVLKGADIRLERLADGRANWEFAGADAAGSSRRDAGAAASAGPAAVRLEQVRIEDGTLSYRDRGQGMHLRAERIDLSVAASTLAGPFAAKGSLRYSGVPLAFDIKAGRIAEGRPTSLAVDADVPEARARVEFVGNFTPKGGEVAFKGKVTASGPDLAALVAALAKAGGGGAGAPAALAREFRLSAAVAGDGGTIAARDLEATLNGTRGNGSVEVSLGKMPVIDATLRVTHLDFDRWLDAAPAAKSKPGTGKTGARAEPGFALPEGIRVNLDAGVGGFVVNKGVVRDIRLRAGLAGGVLTLQRASAALPGGTDASLSGRLRAAGGKPRFDGRVEVDSGDFRGLIRWLGAGADALPKDRLRQVRLRAGLAAGPERVELGDLDLRFDSSRVTGGVVVALRERIGVGARLWIDKLNVDAYLPAAGGAEDKAGAPGGTAPGGGGLGALAAFDANLSLEAGQLTYAGIPLSGVAVDGALVGGKLTLSRFLIADAAGARASAKGTVASLDKVPVPDLDIEVTARDPARLLRAADLPVPDAVASLKPLSLKGNVKADGTSTRVDLGLEAGGMTLTAKGGLRDLTTAPRLDLDLVLGHPDFVRFVRLFAPDFAPESPAEGPLRVAAKVVSAGLDLKLERLEARFAEARFAGAASVGLAALRPVLKADLKGNEIVLDHFLAKAAPAPAANGKGSGGGAKAGEPPWSDEPMDLGVLKLLDADVKIQAEAIAWRRWRVAGPRLDLTLEDGKLQVRRLAGNMVGGSFHMTGGLAAPAKPGGVVAARLDLDVAKADLKQAMFNAADIDVAEGKVDFKIALTGEGQSTRAIARSLAGSGLLDATDGTVKGFDLARVNERVKNLADTVSVISLLQTAMAGGTTRFSRLSGTFKVAGGVLTSEDVELIADGGTGRGRLTVDIGNWRMNSSSQFRLAGNKEAPPFGLELKGPLDAPRRIIKADALQAWLASRAAGALIRDFTGQREQQGSQGQEGGQQTQPSSREQFLRGIFDLLKKK